jgi:hypothetical protein
MNVRDQLTDYYGATALPGQEKKKPMKKKTPMPAKPKGKMKAPKPVKARWQEIASKMAKDEC